MKKTVNRLKRLEPERKPGTRGSVAPVCDDSQKPARLAESATARKAIDAELISEVLFQQQIESFRRSRLRTDSICDLIEVLNYAANHASRSKDDLAQLPQWLLRHLSTLLETVFIAPHPPRWFARIRNHSRQHLLDLVRFQAVVSLRCEGHSVEDAFDLAGQALRTQGYDGGDEAVRWSYKRILKGLRDVEAAMGRSGVARGQDPEEVEAELAARKTRISRSASKAYMTLKRGAQMERLGSKRRPPAIDVPPDMSLSISEALLLPLKVLSGTEHLKRKPSLNDPLLANLLNDGDLAKAAMAFAAAHPNARGIIAFGPNPGTLCKVDAENRPSEIGIFFFIDRRLASILYRHPQMPKQ